MFLRFLYMIARGFAIILLFPLVDGRVSTHTIAWSLFGYHLSPKASMAVRAASRRLLPRSSIALFGLRTPCGRSEFRRLHEEKEERKIEPFSLVAEEMASLGGRLRNMVVTEIPKLASAAEYFFRPGFEGKRFRPMILLLMSSSLSVVLPGIEENNRRIAEITEMIHVASLLHDDVLDHADTRRDIESVNAAMGNKLAVLAGDFLLARAAFTLSTLKNPEVVGLVSKVLVHLVAGEIMQWTAEKTSMEYYLEKTYYKTASLIANSCKSIAILAGHPREVATLAYDYGRNLGLAYQIVDDLLDFTGTKASLGKPTLSDLRQGIATAPVLYALEEFPALQELIDRKFKNPGDVDSTVEMVNASKGIQRTKELAREHANRACEAVASFPPTSSEKANMCRRALTELTERVLIRSR